MLFSLIFSTLFSQPNSVTPLNKVYESYLTGNRQLWRQGIQELNSAFRESAYTDGQVLYELVLSQHGLIGTIYEDKPRDGDALYKLLDEAESNAERLLKFSEYKAQAHSFLGAILSIRVGLNNIKAIYLGSKIEQHYKDAVRINPNHPDSWLEKGNLRFYSPPIFGGDNQEAITCYIKTIALFEQQPELKKNNWHYLHAMAWLGKAYQKEGQKEKAIAVYEKAIAYENRFILVKEELLPAAR